MNATETRPTTFPLSNVGDRTTGPSVHGISGRRLLLALGTWIAFGAAAGIATWMGLRTLAPGPVSTDLLMVGVVAAVYLALPLAFVVVFGGPRGAADRLRVCRTPARELALGVAGFAAAWGATALAYPVLSPVLGPPQEAGRVVLRIGSDYGRLADAGPLMFSLILLRVCLLSPLGEELLFRGALYGWLRQRLPASATILVTAVLFAAVHQSLLLFPLALAVGIGAGWVRERTGSVLPCVAGHLVQNVLVLLVTYWLTGWRVDLT